jgi:hypothetical protein
MNIIEGFEHDLIASLQNISTTPMVLSPTSWADPTGNASNPIAVSMRKTSHKNPM